MSEIVSASHVSTLRIRFGKVAVALACLLTLAVDGRLLLSADEPPTGARKGPAAKEASEHSTTSVGNPFPRRVKAPELDGGTGWLNTGGEITLGDLRKKIVLLDFWAFCCINCMHILPDLKYLEKKYDKQLVVIGVHSAKFANERDSENISRAIMRYEIDHPVINDSNLAIWQKYGVDTWPTLVLIDPEGNYCVAVEGEGHRETIEHHIDRLIGFHRRHGTLDESPIRFDLERHRAEPTPLRFPGKVLADPAGRRLFISDSNHNRIVVTSLDGRLIETIGSGAIGKGNGAYDHASFDHPQGMALVGDTLYVADTDNHMLRAIDLTAKQVRTIAGTGKQGNARVGGVAAKVPLSSPWDLVHLDGHLYIAMAGPHQLWSYDLKRHNIELFAGSGREDVLNGPLKQASMAQPSGITTDGKFLYVADAEGSAIRKVVLAPRGEVTTIAGTSDLPNGRSLFEFGDLDGVGFQTRLQHPLGVLFHAGTLYVADSYNHKIKVVDPLKRAVTTFLGDGRPGAGDDPPHFSEPAGLAAVGSTLYVADTNNHAIRTVDLKTGAVSTLEIKGLLPPEPVKPVDSDDIDPKKPTLVKMQRLAAKDALEFEITLHLPEGYKLNKLAPMSYRLKGNGVQSLVSEDQFQARHEIEVPEVGETLRFAVPLTSRSGKGDLHLTINYGYCRDGTGGLCKLGTFGWVVPIELAADAETSIIRLSAK